MNASIAEEAPDFCPYQFVNALIRDRDALLSRHPSALSHRQSSLSAFVSCSYS